MLGHDAQAVLVPGLKAFAGQAAQAASPVGEQAAVGPLPAPQTEHARQGARPVAFHPTPATQGSWHVFDCVFQA